jgi:hypothetical protein
MIDRLRGLFNSPAAPPGISTRRLGFRRAGDKAAPCNSSRANEGRAVMSFILKTLLGGILLVTTSAVAPAADNAHGAVEQTGGSISQNPSLPKLNLNTAQREQVRQALLTKHTEVEFRLKATKSAKDFTPKIGAKLQRPMACHPS